MIYIFGVWLLVLGWMSGQNFGQRADQMNDFGDLDSELTNSHGMKQPLGGYCPPDSLALINSSNGIAQGCPQAQPCPAGYKCRFSSTRQYLCCGQEGQCPLGYVKYYDPLSRKPIPCAESQQNACPLGTTCLRAQIGAPEQFLCCAIAPVRKPAEDPQVYCANGGESHRVGGRVKICNPIIAMCPLDHQCERAENYPGLNVCCPLNVNVTEIANGQGCPRGMIPEVLEGSGKVRKCNLIDSTSCLEKYRCIKSSMGREYVCCGNQTEKVSKFTKPAYCPGLIEPVSRDSCLAGIANACPPDSVCHKTSNDVMGCCPADTTTTTTSPSTTTQLTTTTTTTTTKPTPAPFDGTDCPNDELPEMFGGSPRSCSPARRLCRQGYECVPRKKSRGHICCRGPRCPGGITVGGGVDGLPIQCSIGAGQCPRYQVCMPAVNNPTNSICCPSVTAKAKRREAEFDYDWNAYESE